MLEDDGLLLLAGLDVDELGQGHNRLKVRVMTILLVIVGSFVIVVTTIAYNIIFKVVRLIHIFTFSRYIDEIWILDDTNKKQLQP